MWDGIFFLITVVWIGCKYWMFFIEIFNYISENPPLTNSNISCHNHSWSIICNKRRDGFYVSGVMTSEKCIFIAPCCKTALSPLLMHWRSHSFAALSHWLLPLVLNSISCCLAINIYLVCISGQRWWEAASDDSICGQHQWESARRYDTTDAAGGSAGRRAVL